MTLKIISRFLPRWRMRSSLDVLATLLNSAHVASISQNTMDSRRIYENSARILGLSELELMRKIAGRLSLPCIERVGPMDLHALPRALDISTLRRAGCVAMTAAGRVTALVCLDPGRVTILQQSLGNVPLCLSTWLAIASALDESERLYLQELESRQARFEDTFAKTAREVVSVIISEAESFECSRVEIGSAAKEFFYQFRLSNGRTARGTIDPEAKESVMRALSAPTLPSFQRLDGTPITGVNCDRSGSYITLSWHALEQSPRAAHLEAAAQGSDIVMPHQARVLLVEDSLTFAHVVSRFMQRYNLVTVHARSGDEALVLLSSGAELPDLIISDVHMPGISGLEFVRTLRSTPKLADLPLIMLTSDDTVESELQALTDGADAFIAKSEDPRLLCVHVKKLLQRGGQVAA